MLEKKVEKTVCDYAKKKGFLTPKINVVGERGWPDRMLIDPEGWIIFVEFKAPGKLPDNIQIYTMQRLEARGLLAVVIDTIEGGKKLVDDLVTARISNGGDPTSGKPRISRVIDGPWVGED